MIIVALLLFGIILAIIGTICYFSSKKPLEGDVVEALIIGSTKIPGDQTNARAVAEYWYKDRKYQWVSPVAQRPIPEYLQIGKLIELVVNPDQPSHAVILHGVRPAKVLMIVFFILSVISFLMAGLLMIIF